MELLRELHALDDDIPVLPTFGNVAGIDIELSKVLHGSEAVTACTGANHRKPDPAVCQ